MVWASTYLLCIPAFAAVYALFPNGAWFYSTIAHEQRHRDYKKQFEAKVEQWGKAELTPAIMVALGRLGMEKPSEVHYSARYLDLDTSLFVQFEQHQEPFHFNLRFKLVPTPAHWSDTTTRSFLYLTPSCDYSDSKCLEAKIESTIIFMGSPGKFEDEAHLFAKLYAESDGESSGRTVDTFFRMLYLSAMSLTTVGYGDIVPLTDMARFAVASEAIVGIVLIGLFLNALSHERD